MGLQNHYKEASQIISQFEKEKLKENKQEMRYEVKYYNII